MEHSCEWAGADGAIATLPFQATLGCEEDGELVCTRVDRGASCGKGTEIRASVPPVHLGVPFTKLFVYIYSHNFHVYVCSQYVVLHADGPLLCFPPLTAKASC